jgi:sterol desaturase/sphingolipid hydroxylase (fatty acid hydroxylase superfamily)
VTAGFVAAIERPVIGRLAAETQRRQWGLVQRLNVSPWVKTALTVVLMDYTLYWWHILLHRVALLWRCHRAHHADLDLDASTAARFHFTEFHRRHSRWLRSPFTIPTRVCLSHSRRCCGAW